MDQNSSFTREKTSLLKISLSHFFLVLLSIFLVSIFQMLLISSSVIVHRTPSDIYLKSPARQQQIQEKIKAQIQKDIKKDKTLFFKEYSRIIIAGNYWLLFAESLLWALCFLLPGYIFLKKLFQTPLEDFADAMAWDKVYTGILYGLAFALISYLMTTILSASGIPFEPNFFQKSLFSAMEGNTMLLLWSIYSLAIVTGIIEELFFRGYLLRHYWEEGYERQGLLLTSIIFGLIHFAIEASLVYPGMMVILGYALGYLYLKYRSIWVPIIAHTVYNTSGLILAYVKGGNI